MNTSIPGFRANHYAQLPTASQMTVNRPGWPTHINSSTLTIKQ